MDWNNNIKSVMFSAEELDAIVTRLAKEISHDYADKKLLLVGILKGSVVFMGDLMKKLTIPCQIDFMKASSYGAGTVSSGQLKITLDLKRDNLQDIDILVIEDIIDSGNTLYNLTKLLNERGAKSVRTCTLFDKPSRRTVEYNPDYCGVEIPDEFIVGYGLDFAEDYRTLPYVGILKEEAYS